MALGINHNLMALNVSRNLGNHYQELEVSARRLSSGLRIGTAADDAAGLAVRELMRSDVSTLNQGVRNANDAISMIQTADGALEVIDEKLIRMKELAEQAATGTYTTDQRIIIDSEFQAMASEIQRIAVSADFNGIKLLDGSLQGPHDGSGLQSIGAAKIHFGTGNDSAEDYYYVDIKSAKLQDMFGNGVVENSQYIYGYNTGGGSETYDLSLTTRTGLIISGGLQDIEVALKAGPPRVTGDGASKQSWIEVGSPGVITSDFNNFEVGYDAGAGTWSIINGGPPYGAATVSPHANGCAIDLDNSGGGDVYIHFDQALAGDTTITFNLYAGWGIERGLSDYPNAQITGTTGTAADASFEIDLENDGSTDISGLATTSAAGSTYNLVAGFQTRGGVPEVKTQEKAQQTLIQINDAIIYKDKIRANLGATQNRLENTISNIQIQAENLQSAESQISDVDVADEMTNFVKEQILTQAATAMLAQANSIPKMAIQLISGG